MNGKDYCNCEHAQMLRDAIEAAVDALDDGDIEQAQYELRVARQTDAMMRQDYETGINPHDNETGRRRAQGWGSSADMERSSAESAGRYRGNGDW